MRKKGKNRSYRREYLRARAEVESLTRVLDGSQLGFWDWDIATGEVRRNAQWAEMLGYRFEDTGG